MQNLRLIARLDVKGPNLVKGVQFEGLRKLGDPNEFARRYYHDGADELLYVDIVASLYERNSLLDVVERTTRDVFIPITVAGGIRSVEDVRRALRAGADKVAINTAALRTPALIRQVAETFGSQCMVLSVEAKAQPGGGWEAYFDNGRERTGVDVVEWVARGQSLGAGEILVTSVDQEGTAAGFDLALVQAVCRATSIPVIAAGGMGNVDHLTDVVAATGVRAVAMATVLHYDRLTLPEIRRQARGRGLASRTPEATGEPPEPRPAADGAAAPGAARPDGPKP